jgi:hypothetical protein
MVLLLNDAQYLTRTYPTGIRRLPTPLRMENRRLYYNGKLLIIRGATKDINIRSQHIIIKK